MPNNQRYMLEKLGISDEIIAFLKVKGLTVSNEIAPVKNPLKSLSEEWFYSIADCYTSPLEDIERNIFYETPHLLVLKIYDAVNILYDVSIVLNRAIDNISLIDNDEEKLVSILTILWVFHGCLDNNYLKYDRHLEYLNYEISPVGYWWKRFRKLVRKALATRYSNDELDSMVDLYVSKMTGSSIRRPIITTESYYIWEKLYKEFKKLGIIDLPPNEIIKRVKENSPSLYDTILEYSYFLYTDPVKIAKDSLIAGSRSRQLIPVSMSSKEKTIASIKEIKDLLDDEKDKYDFERCVEIIEDFIFIQELEGLIAYGKKRNCEYGIFDTLIRGFELLKNIVINNDRSLKIQYKDEVLSILKEAKKVSEMFVADRKMIVGFKKYFGDRIIKRCEEEIRRWKSL